MPSSDIILVSAALIIADEHVLICQRPAGSRLGGYWEFPGGKLEPGESPRRALMREAEEELGVEIEVGRPYDVLYHSYDFGEVLVMLFKSRILTGQPQALHHERILWAGVEELRSLRFLPADQELVQRLAGEMPIWFR